MEEQLVYIDTSMVITAINDLMHSGLFWLLLALILLDVVLGVSGAIVHKELDSSIGTKGGVKHASVILMTIFLGVTFRVAGLPHVSMASAIYFCLQYAISVIENAGKLGLDLPPFLTMHLKQLQEEYEDENVIKTKDIKGLVIDKKKDKEEDKDNGEL